MKTVRLCTCSDFNAELLKDALIAEGIECILGNQYMSRCFGPLISAFSGVDVYVFESDGEKAVEIYKRLFET
ncbi:MAG: DUF2007 domain-containing protein [Prevotellaceae bacterium]|nr:DUF2007 domain-containing protein [Candidatus Colivivens equi]